MKKIRQISAFLIVLALMMSLSLSVFAQTIEEDQAVTNGCHTINAKRGVLGSGQLITNCQTAVLYEPGTDTMMYAWNIDEQIYPASLVKILTALIVAEKGVMTDAVTVRQEVLDTVDKDAVSVDLVADEVITVENLMYCMMVYSANDAAAVLADHIMGSQDAFVAEMNRYAAELGCTATNFTNVHGLHNENQYSTSRDMLRILNQAVKNELFCHFFSATNYTVPATNKSEVRRLVTGNYLMSVNEVEIYYDGRVNGGRTGATALGDRCVASVAEKDGMQLLCLITGAKSSYDENGYKVQSFGGFPETAQLLDLGYDGFKPIQLLHKDQALRQCSVDGGESDLVLGVSDSISSVLPAGTGLDKVRVEYSNSFTQLKAPIEQGATIATVTLWHGSICVGSSELYAMNKVSVYDPAQFEDSRNDNAPLRPLFIGIGITLVVLLAVIVALKSIRAYRIVSRRRHIRKQSQNRRRSR